MARDERGAPFDPAAAEGDELGLLRALRGGDEATFAALLDRYQAAMVRLAMVYVSAPAVAEEVVQETWIGVIQGVDRFEGRSSLKTWLFRILTNQAKRRGAREDRTVPFSFLARRDADREPVVDPGRFFPASHPDAGHWVDELVDWRRLPEEDLLSEETRALVRRTIDCLPKGQRLVMAMRDIEGWTAGEVCAVLRISETNQRVLLHRARSKVRRAIERDRDEA
ncbi:MAG: sigma-70 family RNA polymerase sigma factor [Chloroflexia bacterium]|nr:sigma-70 family RNA polymerase sigma factor [Chloroflexia bacterium]